jgi:predicted transcriptional regulator
MALIPKVEPKMDKKAVSVRLDEEAHTMLQRYAAFLGGATHEYIIGESLKRLFRRDREFNDWLAENDASAATPRTAKSTIRTTSSAA